MKKELLKIALKLQCFSDQEKPESLPDILTLIISHHSDVDSSKIYDYLCKNFKP